MLLVAPAVRGPRWSRPGLVRLAGAVAAAGVLAATVSGTLLYRADTRLGVRARLSAVGVDYAADGLRCTANGWDQICRLTVGVRAAPGTDPAGPLAALTDSRLRVSGVAYAPVAAAGAAPAGSGARETITFRLPDGAVPTDVRIATPAGPRTLPVG